MLRYQDDFTYYYYDQTGALQSAAKCSEVPEDVEEFAKVHDAIGYVQKIGCCGISQHDIQSIYHVLCLDILKFAVQKHGEVFPNLFRGVRSVRADCEHKIMFGATDKSVAEFYGSVKEYHNVKGLRTKSLAVSVVTSDYEQMDEEIIFFPH